MFSLWTRPTIPFKLECESGTIKQDIASQISESIQIINGVEEHAFIANLGFLIAMFISTGVFLFATLPASPSQGCCKNEIASNICHTIMICVHTSFLLWLLYIINRPLLEFPGKHREYIKGLGQARDLLDGCSDDLTRIPGLLHRVWFYEGAFLRLAYILLLMIVISAYGICIGIILGICFCIPRCR